MTPCARGCRSFGKHPEIGHLCTCLPAGDPPVLGPCRASCPAAGGPCTGCLPRPAVRDTLLCGTDLDQLDEWLEPATTVGSVAWARVWLRLCYREGPWRSVEILGSTGTADPPAPSSLAVLDAHAVLADQLAAIVQAMCAWLTLRGPDDGAPLDRVARWIHGHAYDLAAAPFIPTAWAGLHRVMAHAHQVAPWRPARTVHQGIPCPNPDCRELGLVSVSGENTITCETCGTAMTRDDFDRWVRMCAAHERATGARDWRELA